MLFYGKNEETRRLCDLTSGKITVAEIVPDALEVAERFRLKGRPIETYITYLLICDRNVFSLANERNTGRPSDAQDAYVLPDMNETVALLAGVPEELKKEYVPIGMFSGKENTEAGRLLENTALQVGMCASGDELLSVLKNFYRTYGVGELALYKAFTVSGTGKVVPVTSFSDASFEKIFGYERQTSRLRKNAEAFLAGRPSNNVLLYGESGTGKSTAVKALVNEYAREGLRIIEVPKHRYEYLPSVIEELCSRNYRFILYLDDLSFENFEIEYKYLKAVIEGGVQERPENLIMIATSNRRHLVKESFDEREGGGDIHREETMNEKISLSDRFGLQIYYAKPDQQVYFDMVCFMAKEEHPEIPESELIAGARSWAVSRGGFSGRTARQYIQSLSSAEK